MGEQLELLRESVSDQQQAVVNKKYEALLQTPKNFDNPFDPEQVTCTVTWRLPDGSTQQTDAFWYVGYDRRLENGFEVLDPTSVQGWMLRYSPRQAGKYSYRVTLTETATGKKWHWPAIGEHAFEAVDRQEKGFLQVSEKDPAYLCFDDGSLYLGIGHNLCGWEWGGTDNRTGTYEYDKWLSAMGENMATMAQFDFCEGDQLEWTNHPSELPYSNDWQGLGWFNQQNAWKMDFRFQRAEEEGICFRVSLFHWEDFDFEGENFPDWGWPRNPYNIANGGMCKDVYTFFKSPEARKTVRNYLRYVVARWGYSGNVLAWELWNEADAPDMVWGAGENYNSTQKVMLSWHKEMAAYLHDIDVNDHLVTTSYANSYNSKDMWALEDIDLTTIHRYTYYNKDYSDVQYETIGTIEKLVRARMFQTGKPVLLGEFALSPGGDIQKNNDSMGIAFHQQIWASVMTKSLGTAMHWTWGSYIDKNNLYPTYVPLAKFFADVELEGLTAQNSLKMDNQVKYLSLRGDKELYLWFFDDKFQFNHIMKGYRVEEMAASHWRFPMEDGEYAVMIWDTWKGKVLEERTVTVEDGMLLIDLPAFRRDVAVKVVPAEDYVSLTSVDLGEPKQRAWTEQYGKRLSMQAGGTGFDAEKDFGRFAYRQLEGDFSVAARLNGYTYMGDQIRAGLMLRESEAADAPYAMAYMTPSGKAGFAWRKQGEVSASSQTETPMGSYLKLERRGSLVSGYVSLNKKDWTLLGQTDLVDASLAGFAAHAHHRINYCTADFTEIEWKKEQA